MTPTPWSWGTSGLSYSNLDRRANRLAHYLVDLGVGPEVKVAICLERSTELVVALLAVLKAGGAYVPLDPDNPSERLAFLVADSAAPLLLTRGELGSRLGATRARVVNLEAEAEAIARRSCESPGRRSGPTNTAYVIYTSGSTGRPKGVVVTRGNVARLFDATAELYGFGPDDVWPLFHSPAFDVSVWEIWGALLHGGRLVVVPYWVTRSPESFAELLDAEGVTVLNQTPSAFYPLIEAARARGRVTCTLKWVIFAGEALEFDRPRTLVRARRRRRTSAVQHVRHHRDHGPRHASGGRGARGLPRCRALTVAGRWCDGGPADLPARSRYSHTIPISLGILMGMYG